MSNPYEAPNDMGDGDVRALELTDVLFSFNGRIPRSTYWYSYIGSLVAFMIVAVIIGGIGGALDMPGLVGVVMLLLYIPMIWILLAIQVKRWHDRGKSGFWVFIGFIPFIGGIWQLVECGLLEGDLGPNEYGPPTY